MTNKAITTDQIKQYHQDFVSRETAPVIARAVMKNGIKASSEDPTAAQRLNRTFSVELKTGKVSNQKHSGRCWLFSTLNTLRHQFATKYQVKDFELSQNYLFFWDKVERANTFLQNIINTADRDLKDREVAFYLSMAASDGGQWDMAASLVEKYGLVPNYVMPETYNTNNTTEIDDVMNLKLRKDALEIRHLVAAQASDEVIEQTKQKMISQIYQLAAYAFGEPPVDFTLEYRDDQHHYHRVPELTPHAFYEQYFTMQLRDYVVLTNAPDHEYNQLYALPSQDNVAGGLPIQFLNAPIEELKRTAIAQLQDGETVWFGNDVLQQMDRKRGLLDSKLFRRDELLDVDLSMSKADRLASGQAEVTHAMTLTGVDLVNDQPNRWKVENSWGEENGEKGYFVMTDQWFDDYTYEVVVNKKYLTPMQQQLAQGPATVLPAWDSLQ
ncbi:MAG: aminopeptidase [Lactobacillus sp.]|nr:MAG: aminopeptidase [Lactobacillus sp.]